MIPLDSSDDEVTEAQEERYSVHPVQEAVSPQNTPPPRETESVGADREQETVTSQPEGEGVSPEPQGPGQGADPGETPAPEVAGSGACPDFESFEPMLDCCGGTGSCVPMNALPPSLQSQVSTCDDGSACVPKGIITSIVEEGGFWPRVCDSLGGAPGVCLSTCIPKVGEFASLLPQAVCEASERCAPCIDPLTGQDSGACGDGLQCFPNEEAPPVEAEEILEEEVIEEPAASFSCDNPPTEPIVDVESFPSCGIEAHCVPAAAVEPDLQEKLSTCDGGFCVPDPMIASAGFFVSPTCTSVSGMEGRCMSTVLPDIAALEGSLPVDICADHERCSPCCDPMTGLSTGVCDEGCDIGPEEGCTGVSEYVECCGGEGHCIGPELIPDGLEGSLAKCKGEAAGNLCVPDAMQSPDYEGEACLGNSLILGQYHGVCLPKCLKIFLEISFDKSPCAAGHMCVPCEDPLTGGVTDAPGCQP
ncbi:MAG: hypothetical protein ACPGU1_13795 [Myxococcota bacterium]